MLPRGINKTHTRAQKYIINTHNTRNGNIEMLHHRAFFCRGREEGMGNVVEYIKCVNDVEFFSCRHGVVMGRLLGNQININ